MYPAPFRYHRPKNLEQAVALLAKFGTEAKVMAGGQSLIPMMKLRIGDMPELIDIGRLQDLSYIEQRGDTLHIGALATHAQIGSSELATKIPALAEAAGGIADRQVRSMGTIGGGLCVADPSGDWPTVLRLLDATVTVVGGAGERALSIPELVLDTYTTCLNTDEIVREIQLPMPAAGTTSAYVAFKRAAAAFPTCSAGIQLTMDNDLCREARLVLGCAGPNVIVSEEAEALLKGQPINEKTLGAAAEAIVSVSMPPPDARGSEAFKRAMLKTMVLEAGIRALARSRGEPVKGGHRYA